MIKEIRDISHFITLSAIFEKKDDSETFDYLDELFKDISEEKENKNENSLLSKKREKSKNKKNKDNQENLEKKEEKIKKFAYAEKVISNKEYDTKIPPNYSNAKQGSTEDKTRTNRKEYNEKNEKEENKNENTHTIDFQKKLIFGIKKINGEKEVKSDKDRNDYFIPKLCKFKRLQVEKILKKIISDENFKLHPPIQEISHMSLNNLFIFLNISFKNFLTMNFEGLNEFFRFLYELEIIEKCDLEKEVNLNEKQKENALKLLKKLNYVNKENNSKEQDEIKRVLIKLLKDKGYKNDNEYDFTLKDKINFLKLLDEEEIVKSRH